MAAVTVVGLTSPEPDERPSSQEAASFITAIGASAGLATVLEDKK
jgi:hypothetical protein